MTCHQDLPSAAPSPVLAGPPTLAGVVPVSPPPPEPYDDFLRRSERLPPDSAMWVPQPATVVPSLVTERRHGLSLSLDQSEQMAAPGLRALQVISLCPAETDCLAHGIPVLLRHLTDYHQRPNGWKPWVAAQEAAHALTTTVGAALVPGAIVLCHSLWPIVVAILLPPAVGPEPVPPSLVGRNRPAWQGEPPGTCLCHPDAGEEGSQEVKSLPGHSFFQDGNSSLHRSRSTTTKMDYQDRPQRCLSSYPSSCENSHVLSLCYSWKDLPVPCSPVWIRHSTPWVHQIPSTSGSAAPFSGNASSCQPRRVDYLVRFTRTESPTYLTDHPTVAVSGMDYQLEEVYAQSLTHPRLIFLGPHFNLERVIISPPDSFLYSLVLSHLSTSTVMPARKLSSITCRISPFAPFIHHGPIQLRFLQFWIKRHCAQHRQYWDTPLKLDADFLYYLSLFNRPDVLQGVPVLLHRCFTNRMGSQLARSSPLGRVVSLRLLSAHQLAGARGHPISCSSVGTSVAKSDCSCVLRQQYSSGLHPQTRGDSFHIPVQQNAETLSSPGPIWDPSHSDPPSQSQECNRRCPVSTQQSKHDRMEASLRNLFSVSPLVDMFATAEIRVTPIYISTYPDDRVWAVDALSITCDGLGLECAFPPAPIVPKTLLKIKDSHDTTVILIATQDPSRLWHPLLLQLSQRPPIPLLNVALYQYIPNIRRPQFHREPCLLDLAGWLLSGISSNSMTSLTL